MSSQYPEKERARQELAAQIDRSLLRSEVNRRELFRKSGLVLLSASAGSTFLAACGGTSQTSTAAQKVGGNLNFLSWEGYDLPHIITPWLKTNQITLHPTYLTSQDEATAKLANPVNAGQTDVFTYYQAYEPLYSQLGVLTPLDESRIPNLSGLFPTFASDLGGFWVNGDGKRIGAPWTFNSEAAAYDASQIPAPTSYYDLLEPKLKNRLALVNDQIAVFTVASIILGYDISKITQAQETKLIGLIRQFVAQGRTVSASYGDAISLITSGDVAAIWPAFGNTPVLAAQAGKKTVKFVVPKEGGMAATDAWAIPPQAKNVANAYAWINQTLSPAISAKAAEFLNGGTPVKGAVPLLSPTARAQFPYGNIEDYFKHVTFQGIPPQKSDQYMTYAQMTNHWTAITA